MASETKAAAEKKAAAAKAESNGGVESIPFRGLDLALKPKCPLSVPARAAVLRDQDMIGAFRMLESMLADRAEYQRLMDKLDEDEVDIDDEEGATQVGDLLRTALERYGLTQGESEASASS